MRSKKSLLKPILSPDTEFITEIIKESRKNIMHENRYRNIFGGVSDPRMTFWSLLSGGILMMLLVIYRLGVFTYKSSHLSYFPEPEQIFLNSNNCSINKYVWEGIISGESHLSVLKAYSWQCLGNHMWHFGSNTG